MIVDLEKIPGPTIDQFDVCVVGAGAAGICLTVELLRHGKKVLLLEGGGLRFETSSQSLYDGEVAGLPYQGLYLGRTRVFGGTTTEWGGQILEIDEQIFEPREWVQGSGWPILKSELAPYYSRALEFEGLRDSLSTAAEIWDALKLTPPSFGDRLISDFSRWCPTTNFAQLHSSLLKNHRNLLVYYHANACELILADDGVTVNAVRCRTLTGKEGKFSAAYFALCLGGIENSRFLLQPPSNGYFFPWSSNRLIGRHFQDHIQCLAAEVKQLKLTPERSYFDYSSFNGLRYHPKVKLAFPVQKELHTLDACGTLVFLKDKEEELAAAFETYRLIKRKSFRKISLRRLIQFLHMLPTLAWHRFPYANRAWKRKISNSETIMLCVHCEQSPLSESRISLSENRDPLGIIQARIEWRISDQELSTIRQYIEVFTSEFTKRRIASVVPDHKLANDDYIISKCRESSHHMGGTSMAASQSTGVVDPQLKLFGTRNLFVCGTSVFPCGGYANPTHTLLALTVRLANHIRQLRF